MDKTAVKVRCSYDPTMYSGYSVCIQNQIELTPSKCIPSTESKSMLTINGAVNGDHLVFINPIWISPLPMGILESSFSETFTLTGIPVTSVSTNGKSSEDLLFASVNLLQCVCSM